MAIGRKRGRLPFDHRTRSAVAAVMRQSQAAQELLDGATATADEAAEDRLRLLKSLLH